MSIIYKNAEVFYDFQMEANSLLGCIVGGSSVEERKHSAKETSNRDVAGKSYVIFYV